MRPPPAYSLSPRERVGVRTASRQDLPPPRPNHCPMTHRQRMSALLAHQVPDQVPKHLRFTPGLLAIFRERTGSDDPETYYDLELTYTLPPAAEPPPAPARELFAPYHVALPPGAHLSPFGVAHLPGSFHHFTRLAHPLAQVTRVDELAHYPWPLYLDSPQAPLPPAAEGSEAWPTFRAVPPGTTLGELVRQLQGRDRFVVGAGGSIFEVAWQMRGMEQLFADWAEAPALAEALLDHVTEAWLPGVRGLARAGCDMLRIVDDVGTQRGMMMSPAAWRRWLRPRLARLIEAARAINPAVRIQYHSDGSILPIIADLVELGVDLLDPVQPECMDPALVKTRWGDRLCLFGTMGTQSVLPFGTPDQVRSAVRERIATAGQGGGLIIAPTHVLEPDVPWANVEAFLQAVQEYGRYQ